LNQPRGIDCSDFHVNDRSIFEGESGSRFMASAESSISAIFSQLPWLWIDVFEKSIKSGSNALWTQTIPKKSGQTKRSEDLLKDKTLKLFLAHWLVWHFQTQEEDFFEYAITPKVSRTGEDEFTEQDLEEYLMHYAARIKSLEEKYRYPKLRQKIWALALTNLCRSKAALLQKIYDELLGWSK